MKTKKAIELILMPKVFYTFKELRSNMSKTYEIMIKTNDRKLTLTWKWPPEGRFLSLVFYHKIDF